MSFFDIVQLLIIIFAIFYMCYQIYLWIERRTSAKYIKSEDLINLKRNVQLIDVREKDEFSSKHILGARNIPLSQFKQSMSAIRKDQPVYLYDEFGFTSGRAAGKLRRAGYKDIYILKGGLNRWDGKVRIKK